mgnify:CR=1 FL=1
MTVSIASGAARRARGIPQSRVAADSGNPAANISAIETGRRVPRVDTLDRILRASGARLAIIPTTRTGVLEVSTEIRRALVDGDRRRAFRAWLALNDSLAAEPAVNRVVLTAFPPEPTGDELYDAALAALVEYRLLEASAPLPSWVEGAPPLRESRLLTGSPYVTEAELGTVPPSFARRGVLIDEISLQSV